MNSAQGKPFNSLALFGIEAVEVKTADLYSSKENSFNRLAIFCDFGNHLLLLT